MSAVKRICLLFFALQSMTSLAGDILPAQAVDIARDFLGESVSPIVLSVKGTAKASIEEWAPYYVVSRGMGQGYVLVSGNDCLPVVLGYTDHGDFDEENQSPAMRDMLAYITETVRQGREKGAEPRRKRVAATERITVPPLLTTHWDQHSPYNGMCPVCSDDKQRALVGCVATATAQAIYYFRRDLPGVLLASTPTYSGGYESCNVTTSIPKGALLEFDLMFNQYSDAYPEHLKNAIALFCYAVGTASRLSYWHSTGGYITRSNEAMRDYFGLYGTYRNRGDMSLSEWESIIYQDLAEGRPLIFAGFTQDYDSGHAFNLDGYDAKTGLWHFNFGWAGSGDGWYTLDMDTGVNGYGRSQEIVYGITPFQAPRRDADIQCDSLFYKGVSDTVKVSITNHSTLPIRHFRLYYADPESAVKGTKYIAVDSVSIGADETKTVPFLLEPKETGALRLYVTVEDGEPLAYRDIQVRESALDLSLSQFTAHSAGQIRSSENRSFSVIHHSEATLEAVVRNSQTATPGKSKIRFKLYEWNPQTGEETLKRNKIFYSVPFGTGESQVLKHTFTNLTQGAYYVCRVMSDEWQDGGIAVPFYMDEKSLAIDTVQDHCAFVSGEWDADLFTKLASDTLITAYDLRSVRHLSGTPVAANPNALFYVDNPIEGTNIVCNDVCADLRLRQGFDFRPLAPLHASRVSYTPDFVPGVYYPILLPFACDCPNGYVARYVDEVNRDEVLRTTQVNHLEQAVPYVVQSCYGQNLPFTAEDVDVAVEPDRDQTKPFVGSFVARKLYGERFNRGDRILALDTNPSRNTPYYEYCDTAFVAAPFTPLLCYASKSIRATCQDSQEKACRKLAVGLNNALALQERYHTVVCDSMDRVMDDLIERSLLSWHNPEVTTRRVDSLLQELERVSSVYPLMVEQTSCLVDFTPLIVNPSFEKGSAIGWEKDGHSWVRNINNISYYVAYHDGNFFLHNYDGTRSTRLAQTVKGLLPGYYRLSALTGTVKGGSVNLFAGDSLLVAPASEKGEYYFTESVIDSIWVSGSELTIGIQGGDTWYKCDRFRLFYLGNPQGPATAIAPVTPRPSRPGKSIYTLGGIPVTTPRQTKPGTLYIIDGRKELK